MQCIWGCSVHLGDTISGLEVHHQCAGGYYDLCGRILSVHWRDIMSALEGYHDLFGGYHQCIGSVPQQY